MPKEAQGLGNRVSPSGVNRGEHLRTNLRTNGRRPSGTEPGSGLGASLAWGETRGLGWGASLPEQRNKGQNGGSASNSGPPATRHQADTPHRGAPRGHEPQGAGASGVRVSIWEVPRKRGASATGPRRARRAVQDGRPAPAGEAPPGLARSAGCRPHRFPSWSWNRLCGDGPWTLRGKCCRSNKFNVKSP